MAWRIIKNFLDDVQKAKIQILGTDMAEWKPILLETMSEDQIPAQYGGTAPDPTPEEAIRNMNPPLRKKNISVDTQLRSPSDKSLGESSSRSNDYDIQLLNQNLEIASIRDASYENERYNDSPTPFNLKDFSQTEEYSTCTWEISVDPANGIVNGKNVENIIGKCKTNEQPNLETILSTTFLENEWNYFNHQFELFILQTPGKFFLFLFICMYLMIFDRNSVHFYILPLCLFSLLRLFHRDL